MPSKIAKINEYGLVWTGKKADLLPIVSEDKGTTTLQGPRGLIKRPTDDIEVMKINGLR